MKNNLLSTVLSAVLFCCLTIKSSAQVNVTASPSNGCAPLSVNFTATVTNGFYYDWYWNDNTPPLMHTTLSNPTHIYANPTYYQIMPYVYAYDAGNFYLGSGQAPNITVTGAGDSLNSSSYTACPGDQVNFFVQNAINYTVLKWDFGDGNTVANNYGGIQHAYVNVGTYHVYAVVQTTCGNDTMWQVVTVGLNEPISPNAAYLNLYPNDSICPGDAANFNINYQYQQNFVLNFGDGNYSTTSTTHVYPHTGTYAASVTYTNACGNTAIAYDTIHVVNGLGFHYPPSVSIQPNPSCSNSTVNFYLYPSGFEHYLWDFGSNDTSTTAVTSRKFNSAGNYPFTIKVTNGCGVSTTVHDTVQIVHSLPVTGIQIHTFTDSICPGDAIIFQGGANNNSNGNTDDNTYQWDMGDNTTLYGNQGSHTYVNAGIYVVTFTVTNGCGNSASLTRNVYVGPNAMPVASEYQFGCVSEKNGACVGDTLLFAFGDPGNGTVHFDFGDLTSGNAVSNLTVEGTHYRFIKHAYAAPGSYTWSLTYTNSCGHSFVYTTTTPVPVGGGYPVDGQIVYDNAHYNCQGKDVTFYALGGQQYIWDFGDGSGSLVSNSTFAPIKHAFTNAGQYTVTCKITNSCGNSQIDSVVVVVPPSKVNIIANTVSSDCHLHDGKAIAVVNGGTTPYTYQWSNGNSTFLADSLTSGIYVVTVTDVHGCSNFSIATVSDQQAPVIAVNTVIPVACFDGHNGAIDINLIGNTAPYSYIWSNGQTSQDIYQLVSGPYEVTVTDANGCVATKSIMVNQPPAVVLSTISSPPTTCGGNDGSASVAVNGSTGPYAYIWSTGSNTADSPGLSAGVYSVTVVDNNGCIYNADVAVNDVNAPIIVLDSITGTGCGNNLATVYIRTVNGTGPFTYHWSNGATTQNLINVAVGHYTVTATGSNGCVALKEISITKDDPMGTTLCIVTVDTITGMNRVIFVKDTTVTNVAGYNIYKESTVAGLYYLVGYVPFSSHSVAWTDSLSDSKVRSWRYEVSVVDNCGGESGKSSAHKTIHLNTNVGISNSYNLIWDQYEGFNFNTYNIYRFDQANGWQLITSVPNNLISYSDLTPPPNTLAYMVDAVPLSTCSDSTARYSVNSPMAAINNSHSNIKNLFTTTGIQDVLFSPDFSLYPNPSTGIINIAYPFSETGFKLSVYNTVGQLIYSQAISAGDSQLDRNSKIIDLSGFAEGLYTVSFESKNGRIFKKLVLQ